MILLCVLLYVLFMFVTWAILKAGSDADDQMIEEMYRKYKELTPKDK